MNNTNCSNPERLFYSAQEVADMFGVSRKSVYRLIYRGLLKSSDAFRHKMIEARSVQQFAAVTCNRGGVK